MTCAAQLPDRISLFALITKASVLTDIGKRPMSVRTGAFVWIEKLGKLTAGGAAPPK